MRSVGRAALGDPQSVRADGGPGTRGRTSASAAFIDVVDAHARSAGLSIAHDDPYQGGYTTQHYGRPETKVHVVQLELARRLYMDEPTLSKHTRFEQTRTWCTALVEARGAARP